MQKFLSPLIVLALLSPLHLAWNKDKMKAAAKGAIGGDRKVSAGKECGDSPDKLQKIEKNVESLKAKSAQWGLTVDDSGKGYCGYEMTSGKKVQKLDGDKSEDALIQEVTKFFKK